MRQARSVSALLRPLLLSCLWLLACAAVGADQFSACKPAETAVFSNRIHVRCETPVDGHFPFFAVSTADPHQSNRLLSLMLGAELSDKYLDIQFDPADTSGSVFGCATANCRSIKALIVMERVPDRCELDNTQRRCPGFCASVGNNDPDCPGFCAAHDDMRCTGNCQRHPTNPDCGIDPADLCSKPDSSHLPQCAH